MNRVKRGFILGGGIVLIGFALDYFLDAKTDQSGEGGIKVIETLSAAVPKEDAVVPSLLPKTDSEERLVGLGLTQRKIDSNRIISRKARVEVQKIDEESNAQASVAEQASEIKSAVPKSDLKDLYASATLSVSYSKSLRGHSFLGENQNEVCLRYSDCLNGKGGLALAGVQYSLSDHEQHSLRKGSVYSVDRPALYVER